MVVGENMLSVIILYHVQWRALLSVISLLYYSRTRQNMSYCCY